MTKSNPLPLPIQAFGLYTDTYDKDLNTAFFAECELYEMFRKMTEVEMTLYRSMVKDYANTNNIDISPRIVII